MEASSAVGDSGGPAFIYDNQSWRTVGVVSYGTSDSTYGDITVYTRVASHLDWIQTYLPSWAQARQTLYSGWMELDWFGHFFALSNNDSVHFVAAIATGDADGNSNMGINTSRNPACKVMPEIKQPTETMAPVPKKRISAN